jgi:flavin-dependent dehydrogenase
VVVGGTLSSEDRRMLGISENWDADVRRRVCHCQIPRDAAPDAPPDVVQMSLDLGGTLQWAWMYLTPEAAHLVVEMPGDATPQTGTKTLAKWASVLASHKVIAPNVPLDNSRTEVVPITGALSNDGVADRTLLVGPAGGFFSACGEDLYPACWSALFATDVLCEALKKPHLQDALDDYRSCWRTTLGVYLQGPQQNLRFLLPMIYRNPAMTARLVEAILIGKSVVR